MKLSRQMVNALRMIGAGELHRIDHGWTATGSIFVAHITVLGLQRHGLRQVITTAPHDGGLERTRGDRARVQITVRGKKMIEVFQTDNTKGDL